MKSSLCVRIGKTGPELRLTRVECFDQFGSLIRDCGELVSKLKFGICALAQLKVGWVFGVAEMAEKSVSRPIPSEPTTWFGKCAFRQQFFKHKLNAFRILLVDEQHKNKHGVPSREEAQHLLGMSSFVFIILAAVAS